MFGFDAPSLGIKGPLGSGQEGIGIPTDLTNPIDVGLSALGAGGFGQVLKAGAARSGVDAAARTVYKALMKAGLTKEQAVSGSSQAAMIIKQMGKSGSTDVAAAVDRAAFLGAIRGGIDKKAASAIGINAAKMFKQAPAKATVASTAAKFTSFGGILAKFKGQGLGLLAGAAFAPISLIFADYLSDNLDLRDAQARVAIEFYSEGKLTEEELNQNIESLGFGEPITRSYKITAKEEKSKIEFYAGLGPDIGIEQLPEEGTRDFALRVFGESKQQAEKDRQENIKMQEEKASAQKEARLGPFPKMSIKNLPDEQLETIGRLSREFEAAPETFSPGAAQLTEDVLESEMRQPEMPLKRLEKPAEAPGLPPDQRAAVLAAKTGLPEGPPGPAPPGMVWDPVLKKWVKK